MQVYSLLLPSFFLNKYLLCFIFLNKCLYFGNSYPISFNKLKNAYFASWLLPSLKRRKKKLKK